MSDPIFFIEDFFSLGELATRRTRLSKKVARRKRKRKEDRVILECFVEYPGIWAYRIYSNPKKFLGSYVDRVTVQRYVRQLSNEGLIDRDEKDVNLCLRHRKGKKLSTYGIYYLFLNIEDMLDWTFRAILKNYGENILFQLFLYPYLDRKTLLAIQDSALLSRIYLYLQQCCIEIGNISFRNDAHSWQMVPANEPGARRLLNFLEQRYGLPWLKYVSLAESSDKNSWRIWGGANYASIKLDRDKKTATMEIKEIKEGEKQKEYTLVIKEPTPDFFRIRKPVTFAKHYAARYLMGITQQHVPSLLFDLASKVVHGTSDFEILPRDEKFMQSLEKTKVKFDSRYKSLTDLCLK